MLSHTDLVRAFDAIYWRHACPACGGGLLRESPADDRLDLTCIECSWSRQYYRHGDKIREGNAVADARRSAAEQPRDPVIPEIAEKREMRRRVAKAQTDPPPRQPIKPIRKLVREHESPDTGVSGESAGASTSRAPNAPGDADQVEAHNGKSAVQHPSGASIRPASETAPAPSPRGARSAAGTPSKPTRRRFADDPSIALRKKLDQLLELRAHHLAEADAILDELTEIGIDIDHYIEQRESWEAA